MIIPSLPIAKIEIRVRKMMARLFTVPESVGIC
jgi:hypothetical protein